MNKNQKKLSKKKESKLTLKHHSKACEIVQNDKDTSTKNQQGSK